MATAVWTALAVAALVAMFVAGVVVAAAGVRVLENVLARRRGKPSA